MAGSPYLFPAAAHPLLAVTERLKVREAVSGFGIALRYQERAPDPPGAPEAAWCETGHSIFILAGRISLHPDGNRLASRLSASTARSTCSKASTNPHPG